MTKFNRDFFKECSFMERLTLIFAFGLFTPIYIMPLFPVALTVMILKDKRLRNHLFLSPVMKPLFIMFPLLLIVPVAYQNYLGEAASFVMMMILFLSVFFCMRISRRLHEAMLDMLCLGSVFAALISIVERIINYSDKEYRVFWVFANPNYYGAVIVMVALVCVYKVAANCRPRRWYVVIGILNLVGLYLTECRSAWIPIFVGTFFILLWNKQYKLFVVALISFVLALVALWLFMFYDFPEFFPRLNSIYSDGLLRVDIWEVWWKGVKLSPLLGQGPFSYIHIYKNFTDHFDYHSHNMFFEIFLCYGVVGTVALASYFAKIVYMAVKNKHICGRDTLSLMLAVIIAVCIHGLTDYTIFYPQTALVFLLIIGGRRTVSDIKTID